MKTGRHKTCEYYKLLKYLFERNQESVFPAKRAEFYNIIQEFWHEYQDRCEKDGILETYERMKLSSESAKKGTGKEERSYLKKCLTTLNPMSE